MSGMWMSSNVRTLYVTRNENNILSMNEIDPSEIPRLEPIQEDVFLHPLLVALSHSLYIGEEIYIMDLSEEKNKLTEDEFNNLETCSNITNCVICMENNKSNIKLKCDHIFCKNCIKKWLTEKSNTCPNCRIEI